jgi:heme-degrading monooxygenase HmoA
MSRGDGPIAVLNVFTIKPGWLDAFVEVQRTALPGLGSQIPGFRGSRLYRAVDGTNAAMVSVFDSQEHFKRWTTSEAFIAHRNKISTMMERTAPGIYEVVYESGSIEFPVVE